RPARFQTDPVARKPRPGRHIPRTQAAGLGVAGPEPRLPPAYRLAARLSARVQRGRCVCETPRMIPVLVSIPLYLLATGLLVAGLRRDHAPGRAWLPVAAAAMLMHALEHVLAWRAI